MIDERTLFRTPMWRAIREERIRQMAQGATEAFDDRQPLTQWATTVLVYAGKLAQAVDGANQPSDEPLTDLLQLKGRAVQLAAVCTALGAAVDRGIEGFIAERGGNVPGWLE